MTDEEAFWHAIRAQPDDDGPRLIYADWLDEYLEPERAELVRLQCHLDRQPRLDVPELEPQLDRECDLLHATELHWRKILGSVAENRGWGPHLVRGVPESVCVSLDVLLQRGEELLAALPTVREVAVCGVRDRALELARCELLERLDVIEIADYVTAQDADVIRSSQLITSRKVVRVWELDDEEHERLCYAQAEEWPSGTNVELLDIYTDSNVYHGHSHWQNEYAQSGRSLAYLRPQLGKYALKAECRQNLHPGRLPDGRTVLVAHGRDHTQNLTFVYFDEAGHMIDCQERPDTSGCNSCADWLTQEFGYQPQTIWFRQFWTESGPSVYHPGFVRVVPHAPDTFARCWDWLHRGNYCIDWGNCPPVNRRTGRVVHNA
jgi:uncharacterized protein (TIGR02996 family)